MNEELKVLFEHKRGSRKEGVRTMILSPLVALGFWAFQYYIFPDATEDPIFMYGWYGIVITVTFALFFLYGLPSVISNKDFIYRITEKEIECVSPVERLCKSYKIPIKRIFEIEEIENDESPNNYALITIDQEKFEITPNYGNPVHKIIKLMSERYPEIRIQKA